MLGLPDAITALLFDMDGVLTDTASVHEKAWKQMFDAFLGERGRRPFSEQDYTDHVDGKPRADGVRDFLASREISLPDEQVQRLGEEKNDLVQRHIRDEGVRVYEGSRRYLEAARDLGLRRAVVSASANTRDVLHVTGLEELVEGRVDAQVLAAQGLRGKPAPDSYWAGAALLGTVLDKVAVFEDATSGVQAGRDGRFRFVVGVNRLDDAHAAALTEHGASIVVTDLADLL